MAGAPTLRRRVRAGVLFRVTLCGELHHGREAVADSGGAMAERRGYRYVGRMFWFMRKRFVGSYLALSVASRSYFEAP